MMYVVSSDQCIEVTNDDDFIIGDINNDTLVNVVDIVILVNIVLYNEDYNIFGDLNEDGINNVIDIVTLVNIVLYSS